MKRKLLVLLGISVISVNVFGVTTFAEAADATEATETEETAAEDGKEAAAEDADSAEESDAAEGEEENEEAAAQGEIPPVTGDEEISELIDLSSLTEEDDMPDIANMTLAQWNAYEFHKDYATVISDITSYDHDWERELLDKHWSTYIMCTTPNAQVTDEDRAQSLLELHNMRLAAEPISDVEANRIYL